MRAHRPLIYIRTDASSLIGTGHLARCLTLARVLRRRGAEIRFLTRLHEGHLAEWIMRDCFEIVALRPPTALCASSCIYDVWRGVSEADDAVECVAALRSRKPDWLIVDHYGLGRDWESALRPHVGRLMVIDDLPARDHACDAFLDQNYAAQERLGPECSARLLGPRFSLINPVYGVHRACLRERSCEPRRVLLYFGGVDPDNFTGRSLEILCEPEFSHLEVDVVVGVRSPHMAAIKALCAGRSKTFLHHSVPNLAGLMAQADLAIGAGGTTTWERCTLGLPALVLAIAENQECFSEALGKDGIIEYLGVASAWTPRRLRDSLRDLLHEPDRLREMSRRAYALVDGLGAERVAEYLVPSSQESWVLVPSDSAITAGVAPGGTEPIRSFVLQGPLLEHGRAICEFLPTCIDVDLRDEDGVGAQANRAVLLRRLCAQLDRGLTGIGDCDPRLRDSKSARPLRLKGGNPLGQALSVAVLSDASSWLNDELSSFVLELLDQGHRVQWSHSPENLQGGDLCFYLSCGKIVGPDILARFGHNLVVHESALPAGRGWSPLTWQVLEGKREIPITLFEARESVDSGPIYAQSVIPVSDDELVGELRHKQAQATFALCRAFIQGYPGSALRGRAQSGEESAYPKRVPKDSRLDPFQSIASQFRLLRVVDNEAYPAFFELNGHCYTLRVDRRTPPAS